MLNRAPGIEDIFPDKIPAWNRITSTARSFFARYNFREIIIPVMEFTEVFSRGLGDETDIVSKEMFTFEDRGGRSMTLRPEGTASVVRAYCENGDYNRLSSCKLFYIGPMFRAEKPQKGRLRQFNQFGAEFFGQDNAYNDYEVIAMMDGITRELGITDYSLLLNSIGCRDCRPAYITQLVTYLESRKSELCEDCARRLEKNPLRVLDCKKDGCGRVREAAPVISDFLCQTCHDHHQTLKSYLDQSEIKYEENPFLVRGLDYYTRTTFEFVTTALGGQNAFAAGGRYNDLVETFGGKPTPAVGFAAGIERLMLLTEQNPAQNQGPDLFFIHSGGQTLAAASSAMHHLRSLGKNCDIDPEAKSFKNQLKKADREAATRVAIFGEDELSQHKVTVKNLENGEQHSVPLKDFIRGLY